MKTRYGHHMAQTTDLEGTILGIGKVCTVADQQGFYKAHSIRRECADQQIQDSLPPNGWIIPNAHLTGFSDRVLILISQQEDTLSLMVSGFPQAAGCVSQGKFSVNLFSRNNRHFCIQIAADTICPSIQFRTAIKGDTIVRFITLVCRMNG